MRLMGRRTGIASGTTVAVPSASLQRTLRCANVGGGLMRLAAAGVRSFGRCWCEIDDTDDDQLGLAKMNFSRGFKDDLQARTRGTLHAADHRGEFVPSLTSPGHFDRHWLPDCPVSERFRRIYSHRLSPSDRRPARICSKKNELPSESHRRLLVFDFTFALVSQRAHLFHLLIDAHVAEIDATVVAFLERHVQDDVVGLHGHGNVHGLDCARQAFRIGYLYENP